VDLSKIIKKEEVMVITHTSSLTIILYHNI